MTLCGCFRENSKALRRWLVAQPHVKEESLTDWLLYRIDVERTDVIYKAFTRHEEARTTGADWEWWMVFPDGAMRFRVQAKKLTDGDNYPSIAHSNKYGMQISKLLSDAKAVNAFPLYAFYSTQQPGACPMPGLAPEGAHLASAFQIDDLLSSRTILSTAKVLSLARPLSCLVCCPLASEKGRAGLVQFVRQYFDRESHAMSESGVDGQHQYLPPFVSSFLERRPNGDSWEREFSRDLEGIDALMVVDLRSN